MKPVSASGRKHVRRVRWTGAGWLGLGAALVAASPVLISAAEAATGIPSPPAGTYVCWSTSLQLVSNGAGGTMLMSVPAYGSVGKVGLDGKGGYQQLIQGGGAGRYTVNAASGEFKFVSGPLLKLAAVYEFKDDGFKSRTYTISFKKSPQDKGSYGQYCQLVAKSSGQPLSNVKPTSSFDTAGGKGGAQGGSTAQPSASNPNPGFKGTILFHDGTIQSLDLASGKRQNRFSGGDPSFAPTGEIVYVNSQHQIVIAGKDYTRLQVINVPDDEGGIGQPVLSPDGKKVAYYSEYSYQERGVVVRSRAGQLLAKFDAVDSPNWTPNGRLLVAASTSTEGSKPGLFLSNQDLSAFKPIPVNTDDVQDPALSPDGQQVAFTSGKSIWTVRLDGSGLKQRVSDSDGVQEPQWGPDSRSLLMRKADETEALLILGPNDTAPRRVLDASGESIQASGRVGWR
ncbi:TolB family protein [Deinococcus sp.]|uniref:TolB family protein n=1 Tax=Deinococcus sp. TaxID=47478 RepID=UPI003C7B0330